MDQAPDPEPAATAPPDWVPWGAMLFVANISVFVLLALGLTQVPQLKDVYGELSPDPDRIPAVMELNRFFEAIHIPLWVLAVAGLGGDLGVWWAVRRQGRYRTAFNWMWLLTAGVMLLGVIIIWDLFVALFLAPIEIRT